MITPEEDIVIREKHSTSWKGIYKILKNRGTFKKWPFLVSLIIAFLFSGVVSFYPKNSFSILQSLSDTGLLIFPTLLGFSLGGYAIVVGFSNNELLKSGAKKDKYSVYQKLNAIFAISILFQVIVTISIFIITWIIKIDIVNLLNLNIPIVYDIINVIILFFLTSSVIYSLLLLPFVVLNLFSLSQINNLYFTIKKFTDSATPPSDKNYQ